MIALEGGVWTPKRPGIPAIVQLEQALKTLTTIVSVMNIGAHPDDERSDEFAYWALGLGVRVISVTATRGEGGQNQLGPELYDALGVIRTRELEEAAAITGVTVDFLGRSFDDPIHDFGFSKTSHKAFTLWGEENLLAREVEMIRKYRPDVLVSSHNDAPEEQGQHRALAVTIPRAVVAAADPASFPEQVAAGLLPWQVKKVYFPASEADATVAVPVGEFDPTMGMSYGQIGELSRAKHEGQGMGHPCKAGPAFSYLALKRGPAAARETETSIFDGLPLTFADWAQKEAPPGSALERLGRLLVELDNLLRRAVAFFPDRDRVVHGVHAALALVRRVREEVAASPLDDATRHDLDFRLGIKEEQLALVSVRALLLMVTVSFDKPVAIPGDEVQATVSLLNGGHTPVSAVRLSLYAPAGWEISACGTSASKGENPAAGMGTGANGGREPWRANAVAGTSRMAGYNEEIAGCFRVKIPEEAPYYHPYQPAAVGGMVSYEVDGVGVSFSVRPKPGLAVLPPVSVAVSSEQRLIMPDSDEPREVRVTLKSFSPSEITGRVALELPSGWISRPDSQVFSLTAGNTALVARFTVEPPPAKETKPGRYPFLASVRLYGDPTSKVYSDTVSFISYPHIGRDYMVTKAEDSFLAVNCQIAPGLRVGWVNGGFDRSYEIVRGMGATVDLLGPDEIASGDLSPYDVIVIGIRAYLSRPELSAFNGRLLGYVRDGGFLLVNYHKPGDSLGSNPPYELVPGSLSIRWRVSDENAPVTVLKPEHAFFNWPNRITGDDWAGWVQERGLYFAMKWAPEYTPLVSMSDPGEDELRGGLLFARYGKGAYTYTGLSWYRQLQALVPGGIRIFANLLSYSKRFSRHGGVPS
ncbi:MAG: PIG-L family deacetylase [Syntrophothermus sp.]